MTKKRWLPSLVLFSALCLLAWGGTVQAGNPPTVTGVSPDYGSAAGGTNVTISGTGFHGATQVCFGYFLGLFCNPATSFNVVNSTTITAVSPAAELFQSVVDVTVTTPNGTSPANPPNDQFTYVTTLSPTVTGVNPNGGPSAGGTVANITGTNFGFTILGIFIPTVISVDFGLNPAAAYTVDSSTQLTATSPPGTGTVDVSVCTLLGVCSPPNPPADQFTYTTAPVVTGLVPAGGPATGGNTVTVGGNGFTGATVVDFGTAPATNVVVVSDTQVTATAPPGSDLVCVTVTAPGGTSACGSATQYAYVPVVTGVTPSSGPAVGGTSVDISGQGFTGATAVDFGANNPATQVVVVSDTEVTDVSPAGGGTVDVTVTTPGGTSASGGNDQFTYQPAPARSGCFSFAMASSPWTVGAVQPATVTDTCGQTFSGAALLLDQTGSLAVTSGSGYANTGDLVTFVDGIWQGTLTIGRATASDRFLVSAVDNQAAVGGASGNFAVHRNPASPDIYVTVNPLYALVPQGETAGFSAAAYDQNGAPLSAGVTFAWSGACSGNGSTCDFNVSVTGLTSTTVTATYQGQSAAATAVVVETAKFASSVQLSPANGQPDASGVAGWAGPLPLVAGQPAQPFSATDFNPGDCPSGSAPCTPSGGAWAGVLQAVSPGVTAPPALYLLSSGSLAPPAVSGPPGTSLKYLMEYDKEDPGWLTLLLSSLQATGGVTAPNPTAGADLVQITSDPREVLVKVTENGGHPSAQATVWANGGYVAPKSWQYLP